jgi:hypothetical protein
MLKEMDGEKAEENENEDEIDEFDNLDVSLQLNQVSFNLGCYISRRG